MRIQTISVAIILAGTLSACSSTSEDIDPFDGLNSTPSKLGINGENFLEIAVYPGRAPDTVRRQVRVPITAVIRWAPYGKEIKLIEGGGGQMQAAFNKARALAGLDDDVTPHVLRHTWATWFYAQTRDFGGLMDQGSWSKADMANRYRKMAPDDLTERPLKRGWNFRPQMLEDRRARMKIV